MRPGRAVGVDVDAAAVAAYPALLGYARLLTGNRGRAEDVVHEALVRCLRRARTAPIRDFVPYARRAVLHEAYRDARRRSREPILDPIPLGAASPGSGRVDEARPSSDGAWSVGPAGQRHGAPDIVVDQQELRSWLARLPVRQRAAVVCRYYLDMTERDTAELLGCSVSAVKSLCHRGIALLRDTAGTSAMPAGDSHRDTARTVVEER